MLLFGGGNVQTGRHGDPGTWTYDPAANAWEELKLDEQPAPRGQFSPMVYNTVNQQVVLFGGDQLNQLLSDTWTFNGRRWEEKKPALAPAPRGGHALLWLPLAKKVLLLGGYGYESAVGYYPAVYRDRPLEAWTYDAAGDKWQFVASWSKDCPLARPPHPLRAAAGADDLLAVVAGGTWLCKLEPAAPDRLRWRKWPSSRARSSTARTGATRSGTAKSGRRCQDRGGVGRPARQFLGHADPAPAGPAITWTGARRSTPRTST